MKKQLLTLIFLLYAFMALAQQANNAPALFQCQNIVFNLTVQNAVILGDQNPQNFSVTYYITQADAEAGVNSIPVPMAYGMSGGSSQRIYARVSDNTTGQYAITSFEIIVLGFSYRQPDIASCGSYTLPALPAGLGYYMNANGVMPIPVGTAITTNTIVYIYGNTEGCVTETSFFVSIVPMPPFLPDVTACGSYTIPASQNTTLYTQPNGGGTVIPAGTTLTNTMTLYPYNGFCNGNPYTITVLPAGTVTDEPRALSACEMPGMEGTASFNLNVVSEQIIEDYPSFIQLYYFTSLADAENYVNPITNIEAYQNVTPYNQTLYVMLDVFCGFRIIPIELEVLSCNEGVLGLSGTIKLDENANGCDIADAPLQGIAVGCNIGNYMQYAYTDVDGNYSFYGLPNGTGNVWIQNINGQNFLATPTSLPIAYEGTLLQQDFCLTAPAPVQDIVAVVSQNGGARPGFTASYYVTAFNAGNTVSASGTITLTFNPALVTPANINGGVLSGNTITWAYTNLQPQASAGHAVTFTVATPPTVVSGTLLSYTANVTTEETDAVPTNNTYVLNQFAVNSYDPNDITVKEGEIIFMDDLQNYLHYTVRFQNSGTANAEKVRIVLPLDANLNVNTFQPISASHNYRVYRSADRVEFIFDNINLPYESANEPGSHGFVNFRIKPDAGLVINDSVSETASIFFDFNEAIVTNTVTTTVQAVAATEVVNKTGFSLLPNPANGSVRIVMAKGTDNNAAVTITDVLGKKLLCQPLPADGAVNISNLSAGIYMVTVMQGAVNTTQKLIIK